MGLSGIAEPIDPKMPGGRKLGGWSDSIRIDPNYSSLPGTVIQRDRQRGRVRLVLSGEFILETGEPTVSAINVGTLKATTSDADKYCMLDSGANVMVAPPVEGMTGDQTMCSLVGDKRTPSLITS